MLLEVMDYQHLTKDRSLGTVELKVADLAQESEDPRFHYSSLGKKEVVDPIRLDRGNSYKGQLHYVAEFVPAIALKGVRFDTPPNELQTAIESGGGEEDGEVMSDAASSISSSSEEAQAVPNGVTARAPMGDRSHTKGAASTDTTGTKETTKSTEPQSPVVSSSSVKGVSENGANGNGNVNGAPKEPEDKGVEMSREELLQQRALWSILSLALS